MVVVLNYEVLAIVMVQLGGVPEYWDKAKKELSAKDNILSTQLIYAYKINPQTVFYLGYSDNSYQDDRLKSLERAQRTIYSKISYAWLP